MKFIRKKSTPRVEKSKGKKFLGGFRTIVESVVIVLLLRAFVVEAHAVPTGSMKPTIEPGEYLLAEKLSFRFGDPMPGDVVVFEYPLDPRVDYVKRCIATEGQTVEFRSGTLYVDGAPMPDSHAVYAHPLPPLPDLLDIPDDQWQDAWELPSPNLHVKVYEYLMRNPRLLAQYYAFIASYYSRNSGIEMDYDSFYNVVSNSELEGTDWREDLRRALYRGYDLASSGRLSTEELRAPVDSSLKIGIGQITYWAVADNFQKITVPEGKIFCMGDNRDQSFDSRFWGPVPMDNVKGRPVLIYYSVEVKPREDNKTPTIFDNILVLVGSFFRPGDIRPDRFFRFLF